MDPLKLAFLKTIDSIRDYLPQVVIGGGWAPLVYFHYLLGEKHRNPLRTQDIDLVVAHSVPLAGPKTLDELLENAGLKPIYKTLETPPLIHYEGEISGKDVEVQFITDQQSSRGPSVVVAHKGIHAEALRFVSILLENTIEVEIDDFPLDRGPSRLAVRVAAPGAYVFHKGLVFPRRKDRLKRGKDLYYIFDLLAARDDLLNQVVAEIRNLKEDYAGWFRKFIKNIDAAFSDLHSDLLLLTAEQRPTGAFPSLNREQFNRYVHGTFRAFLEKVSGK
jgi:hypothetical protein